MRLGAQSRLLQLVPQMSSLYGDFHDVFLDMYHLLYQAELGNLPWSKKDTVPPYISTIQLYSSFEILPSINQ